VITRPGRQKNTWIRHWLEIYFYSSMHLYCVGLIKTHGQIYLYFLRLSSELSYVYARFDSWDHIAFKDRMISER